MCLVMVFNMLFGQMDKVQELLPGIEDFLCRTLASENLSENAEQQRLYFVERLDILQLPPSVPPRCNATKLECSSLERLHGSPDRLQNSPDRDIRSPTSIEDAEDFVAYQRELSRSLLSGANSEEELLKVKLYDDIDHQQNDSESVVRSVAAEINFYEIPVPKGSDPPKSPKENDYEETAAIAPPPDREETSTSPVPPPLPPRRDRTASDNQSRSSCGSILEEVKPSLPIRPQLTPKSEIIRGSKEKLVEDDCDELDGTSYESYEEEDSRDASRFNVKLPKPVKKSSKSRKISKSRSSKEWDLNIPFKCLEEVTLSGELLIKGKLSWTKKICALSEGRLLCYKPDKCDSKPAIVIQLTGYNSTFSEKDNRKGFDIKLTHPSLEVHLFSVDIKDWAVLWCDYINAMAEGRPPPGQYRHLVRSCTFPGLESSQIYGSKMDMRAANSVASLISNDGFEQDFVRSNSFGSQSKGKVTRMGSFAVRASQFFETFGKKAGRKQSSMSNLSNFRDRSSTVSSVGSPVTPVTTPDTPVFLPEIPCLPAVKPATHQGYLCIYSNFNKRKWGPRWCIIRDNSFECYKNEKSTVCELDFLLRFCKLRRAVSETKSELGLMLVEKAGEKITVEPLSREEMRGWLKVLMSETSTEKLPEGLEEFWVEDESPYHDINPRDLLSPTSDAGGYSSIKEHFEIVQQKSQEVLNDDSILDVTSNTTLVSDNQIPVSPQDGETEGTKIQGEITGDLYSQVQRKSSTGSVIEESQNNDVRVKPESVFTFDEQESSHDEGGMFAEILNKINDHFSRENSCVNCELGQSDTAYNSAGCSENSSLERKPHQDVHSVSENFDTLSQGTDIQVSPLEDFGPDIVPSDTTNIPSKGYINHFSANSIVDQSSNLMQICDQSTRTNFEYNQSILNQSNNSFQSLSQTETNSYSWTYEGRQTHLSVEPKSRDQCDSAIFESESILEDLDNKALLRKIDQLRTHLVELKKTRISVRNQKEQAALDMDKRIFDEEYHRLDEECRTISDEISQLEDRLAVHGGLCQ